jgi:CRISPR/Cas system CSM-associated protein Csm3 (group 7 of RAMP superfamily)
MAREIISRIHLRGTLVAQTPLHVGGHGDDVDTDLPLARDGAGDLYVPGTSLAGALRQWCELAFGEDAVNRHWGFQDADRGHASYVVVEDVPVNESGLVIVEVRDGVGIDRESGAAAEGIKYDRAILPRGTKLGTKPKEFALSAEVENLEQRLEMLAMLAALKEALEAGRVRLGASKTRGLGRVLLENATFAEQKFNDRQGILAVLKDGGERPITDLRDAREKHPAKPMPRLELQVHWRPAGPLMVKAGFDGVAVDMLPLTSGSGGGLSLVLPGSSVKGVMRTHAERIVRTVLGRDLGGERDPKKKFLRDLELPLIDDLFGLRGLSEADVKRRHPQGEPKHGPLPGLSAIGVDDCFGTKALSAAQWQTVQAARSDPELRAALDAAGLLSWSEAYHVAVDRWTGAAGESMLYTVLEPHGVEWEPLCLEIDLARLSMAERVPAVALLLLVLRDLAQGRLPLGFATHRGMGAVVVDSAALTAHQTEPPLDRLQGVTVAANGLAGVPSELNAAWQDWIKRKASEVAA